MKGALGTFWVGKMAQALQSSQIFKTLFFHAPAEEKDFGVFKMTRTNHRESPIASLEVKTGENGHFPFFRTGRPDRSVHKPNVPILRVSFMLQNSAYYFWSDYFFKILQHHLLKMTNLIYRLAGLAGQFWQTEST